MKLRIRCVQTTLSSKIVLSKNVITACSLVIKVLIARYWKNILSVIVTCVCVEFVLRWSEPPILVLVESPQKTYHFRACWRPLLQFMHLEKSIWISWLLKQLQFLGSRGPHPIPMLLTSLQNWMLPDFLHWIAFDVSAMRIFGGDACATFLEHGGQIELRRIRCNKTSDFQWIERLINQYPSWQFWYDILALSSSGTKCCLMKFG